MIFNIHKLQGGILGQSFTVEHEGKKIPVVRLEHATNYIAKAYRLGKEESINEHVATISKFNKDKKIDRAIARLHRLLDKYKNL